MNRMLPQPVKALAFSPDGEVLATGGDAGRVDLFVPRTLRRLDGFELSGEPVTALAISPWEDLIAVETNRRLELRRFRR